MYNLPYFKEKDEAVVLDFVRQHPFAFLCGSNSNSPVVTQIPVFTDERDGKIFLSGHMMRNSDHHKAFVQNSEVLAVFTGANHYVSASWYENKQQGSTWNYQSVHMRGKLSFLDEKDLIDVLKRTTAHFENDPNSGANFDDLPESYIQSLIKAIVAFSIEVIHIDNVFKLSQNRDQKSYENIIMQLRSKDADAIKIAEQMELRKSKLFPHE